jgi:hypothetical protein
VVFGGFFGWVFWGGFWVGFYCQPWLKDLGLGREVSVTPLIEFLVGQGKAESAATVAAIFPEHVDPRLKFLSANNTNNIGDKAADANAAAAKVDSATETGNGDSPSVTPEPADSSSSSGQADETLACLVKQMVEDDKISDLGKA